MRYVLFLGGRLGFESLKTLINLKAKINYVFIESEHTHEIEKYANNISELLIESKIRFTKDPKNSEIVKIMEDACSFDYLMTFGYRRLISKKILKKAKIAAIGSHFSPLPKYRGFAPLNWLIINGEKETAVNLFHLSDQVDSGDIINSSIVPIYDNDNINTLLDRCINSFKLLINETYNELENYTFSSHKQNHSEATYTCSRNPEDGTIDWSNNSKDIYNFVRALTPPFPGAFTYYKGERIIIIDSEKYNIPNYVGIVPGKVIKIIKGEGVVVLCGNGALLIRNVIYKDEVMKSEDLIKSVRITLGR